MKCPECVAEGKRSKVYVGGHSSTLMGYLAYYDEDGKLHDHDPNVYSTNYRCSNGHKWTESKKNKCWCEVEKEDATITD